VFDYRASDTQRGREVFDDFRGDLNVAIVALRKRLENIDAIASDPETAIDQLHLEDMGAPPANPAELRAFWVDNHSVVCLEGRVKSNGDIESEVYLGHKRGERFDEGIALREHAVGRSDSSDPYLVLLLYGLALDARQRQLRHQVVLAYVSEAVRVSDHLDKSALSDDLDAALKAVRALKDNMIRLTSPSSAPDLLH
jgi:hypothetical protein